MARNTDITHQNLNPKLPVVFWYALIVDILLIGVNVFRWELVDLLTPFLQPLLELLIILLFSIGFIWSLVYFFRINRFKAGLSLGINIVVILIVIIVPTTALTLEQDFNTNLKDREQVISMVKSGELKPNVQYNSTLIKLPLNYKHLSKGGGEIVVERNNGEIKILFFTFRGVLDNFSGFVYFDSDKELTVNDLNGDFKEIRKMKEHWYWGSSS